MNALRIFKFVPGDKAKDNVTGFVGTVTAACQNINSENSYRLEAKNGNTIASFDFGESRLVSVSKPKKRGSSK